MSAQILPGFRIETLVFGKPGPVAAVAQALCAQQALSEEVAPFIAPSHTVLSQLGQAHRLPAWFSPPQPQLVEDIFDHPSRELHKTLRADIRLVHDQHPETLVLTLMRRDVPESMKDHYALMFSGCLPASWGVEPDRLDAMFGSAQGRGWWMCRDLPYEAQKGLWSELWNNETEFVDSLEAVFHRMGWQDQALPWAKVQRQSQALDDTLPAAGSLRPRMGRF